MAEGLRFIGVLVLTPDQIGFVDPVFQNGDKRYIQRSLHDINEVTGFDEITLAFAVEPHSEGAIVERSIGDRRLFAFRFGDGTVALGDRNDLASRLRLRFADFYSDDEFRRNPMLFFDVLSFLEFDDALAQEMSMRTLWATYDAARESQQNREAPGRLFQYGFAYAGASGRFVPPFEAGILCLRESDFRPAVQVAIRRLKTGRLVPVFCLMVVTVAIVAADRLREVVTLPDAEWLALTQGLAGFSVLWFVYEASVLSGRMSPRRAVDWLVERLRAIMLRR